MIYSIVMTDGIHHEMDAVPGFKEFVSKSFARCVANDWGEVCDEDRKANDDALKNGDRILAVYKHEKFKTVWIIIEADRSATMVLFPDEY